MYIPKSFLKCIIPILCTFSYSLTYAVNYDYYTYTNTPYAGNNNAAVKGSLDQAYTDLTTNAIATGDTSIIIFTSEAQAQTSSAANTAGTSGSKNGGMTPAAPATGTDLGTTPSISINATGPVIIPFPGGASNTTLINTIPSSIQNTYSTLTLKKSDNNPVGISFPQGPGIVQNIDSFAVSYNNATTPTSASNSLAIQGAGPVSLDGLNTTAANFAGSISGMNGAHGGNLNVAIPGKTLTLLQNAQPSATGSANNQINMATVRVQDGTLIAGAPNMFAFNASQNPITTVEVDYKNLSTKTNVGTFQLNAPQTIAGLTSNGTTLLNNQPLTIQVPDGAKSLYTGVLDYSTTGASTSTGSVSVSGGPLGTGIQDVRINPTTSAASANSGGKNAYSGPTTITGATLVEDTNSLPAASVVTVNAGTGTGGNANQGTLIFNQSQVNADATYVPMGANISGTGNVRIEPDTTGHVLTLAGTSPTTFTGTFIVDPNAAVTLQGSNYFAGANSVLPAIQNDGTINLTNTTGATAPATYTVRALTQSAATQLNQSSATTPAAAMNLTNVALTITGDANTAIPFNYSGGINATDGVSTLAVTTQSNSAQALVNDTMNIPGGMSIGQNVNLSQATDGQITAATPVTFNPESTFTLNNPQALTNAVFNDGSIVDLVPDTNTQGSNPPPITTFTAAFTKSEAFKGMIGGTGDVAVASTAATGSPTPLVTWGDANTQSSPFTGTFMQGAPNAPIDITPGIDNFVSPTEYQLVNGNLNLGARNLSIESLSGATTDTETPNINLTTGTMTITPYAADGMGFSGTFNAPSTGNTAGTQGGTVVVNGQGTQRFTGSKNMNLNILHVAQGNIVQGTNVDIDTVALQNIKQVIIDKNTQSGGVATLHIDNSGLQNATGTYAPTVDNRIIGTGQLSFDNNTTILAGVGQTYTGSTVIQGGTVQMAVPNWFTYANTADSFVANGTFDLHGNDQTINNLVTYAEAGVIQNSQANETILTINQQRGNTYKGSFAGNLDVIKTGPQFLIASGTVQSTNTGPTTVEAGVLSVTTTSLSSQSAVTINTAPNSIENISSALQETTNGITGVNNIGEPTPGIPIIAGLIIDQTTAGTYAGGLNGAGDVFNLGSGPLTLNNANNLPCDFTGNLITGQGSATTIIKNNYFVGNAGVYPAIQNEGTFTFAQDSGDTAAGTGLIATNYKLKALTGGALNPAASVTLSGSTLDLEADGIIAPLNFAGTITGANNGALAVSLKAGVAATDANVALRTASLMGTTPNIINIPGGLTVGPNMLLTQTANDLISQATPVTFQANSTFLLNNQTQTLTDASFAATSTLNLGTTGGNYTGVYNQDEPFDTTVTGVGTVTFLPTNPAPANVPTLSIGDTQGSTASTFSGSYVQGAANQPININIGMYPAISPNTIYNVVDGTLDVQGNALVVEQLVGSAQAVTHLATAGSVTVTIPTGIMSNYIGAITSTTGTNGGTFTQNGPGTQNLVGSQGIALQTFNLNNGTLALDAAGLNGIVDITTPNQLPVGITTPTILVDQTAGPGVYTAQGPISGASQFQLYAGTLTVGGTEPTYTGPTTLNAGTTLNFAPASNNFFAQANMPAQFVANGTINLGSTNQTFNNLTGAAPISGTGAANGTASQLIVNQSLASTTPGAISGYDGVITGNIAFVKEGPAPYMLNAANTYTGSTQINQGLLYASSTTLPNTSTIVINTASNDVAALTAQINAANPDISGFEGFVFNQDDINNQYTLAGGIKGTGDFIKMGAGSMYIPQSQEYIDWTGTLAIVEGIVSINTRVPEGASLPNSTIIVGPNGTLKGNGDMGTVTSYGNVSPGNSIGLQRMAHYNMTPQNIANIEIAPDGSHDVIQVQADLPLNGTLNIIPTADPSAYVVGTEYLGLLTTEGNLTGDFISVNLNGYAMVMNRDFIQIVPGLNGSVNLIFTQNLMNMANLIANANRPYYAESNAFLLMSTLGQQYNMLTNRMSLLQSGLEYTTGLWALPYWNTLRLKNRDGSIACKSTTEGITVGRDTTLENGAIVGIAGGYENTYARYKSSNGTAHMNSLHAGIYANYELDQFCFETTATAMGTQNRFRRTVTVSPTSTAQNKGRNYMFGFEATLLAGYVIPYESTDFMPYVGVNLYGTRENKYTESSTSNLRSAVQKRTTASVEEELGLRTNTQFGAIELLTDIGIARSHFIHDSNSKSIYVGNSQTFVAKNLRYNYPIEGRASIGVSYKYTPAITYALMTGVKVRRSALETALYGSISISM